MNLAFCLYHYFPFGGLQRDFLRIAEVALAREHEVTVFTTAWQGDYLPGLKVEFVPISGVQNHTRSRSFSINLQKLLKDRNFDAIVGFNKMPGLDIYYTADVCYLNRIKTQKPFWYRLLPRYQQYLRDEIAVFSPQAKTRLLVLAAGQRDEYITAHGTQSERFHLLTPGIGRDRIAPPHANLIRSEVRKTYHLKPDQHALLFVGSGFKTKGLDRALDAIAALPKALKQKTHLWVIGQGNPSPFLAQAKRLDLTHQVTFLGGRHDVPRFLLAADFLIHPAYHENTGTVILEALVAGLPVLTTDICGYAQYIQVANAGLVLSSPFKQSQMNRALETMLVSELRAQWQQNGLDFAHTADLYSLPEKAVAFIEDSVRATETAHVSHA